MYIYIYNYNIYIYIYVWYSTFPFCIVCIMYTYSLQYMYIHRIHTHTLYTWLYILIRRRHRRIPSNFPGHRPWSHVGCPPFSPWHLLGYGLQAQWEEARTDGTFTFVAWEIDIDVRWLCKSLSFTSNFYIFFGQTLDLGHRFWMLWDFWGLPKSDLVSLIKIFLLHIHFKCIKMNKYIYE